MKRLIVAAIKVSLAVFVALVLFVVWDMWNSSGRSKQVAQEVCAFAQSGKTVDEVKAFALSKKCELSITSSGDEFELAVKPKEGVDTRYHRCMVYYKGQRVTRAVISTYNPR